MRPAVANQSEVWTAKNQPEADGEVAALPPRAGARVIQTANTVPLRPGRASTRLRDAATNQSEVWSKAAEEPARRGAEEPARSRRRGPTRQKVVVQKVVQKVAVRPRALALGLVARQA